MGPFQHIFSLICVDHLARTSVTPFDARLSRDLATVSSFPRLPMDVPVEAAFTIFLMDISGHFIAYLTGEKKWSLPSSGEEYIKILPLGNTYEKTLIWVFVVCGFSIMESQFLSHIEMSLKMFEFYEFSLKFQSLFLSLFF